MLWKIVLSIVAVGVLAKSGVLIEAVPCYTCANCVELTGSESVECVDGCAIWKNSANEINRGCKHNDVEAEIKHECNADFCNDATVPVCQKCSEKLDDCQTEFCKINDDDDDDDNDDNGDDDDDGICYISKKDESRGCASELVDRGDEGEYTFCNTDNCNRVALCVKCNSDEHPDCLENWTNYADEKCLNKGVFYTNSCFRKQSDDASFELGCTSDLPNPSDSDTKELKKCADDNCNRKAFMKCYSCYGDCHSIDPDNMKPDDCLEYYTTCLTGYFRDEKEVYRSCSELVEIEEAGFYFYKTCDESLCNSYDFPTHLQCYQCNENCETLADTNLEYCANEDVQYCFTLRTDGGELIHGCDKDEPAEECRERENCRTCETDGCNGANPKPTRCTRCETSEDCKSPGSEPEECEFFEDCFLDYGVGELTKGCSSRLESCNAETCELCPASGCNEHHCVQCDSEKLEDCVTGRGNVGYELCPAREKCVAFVNEQGFTVRGCKISFPELDCTDDSCKEFDGPGSNDEPFPEHASQCYHCTESGCEIGSTAEQKNCPSNSNGCFTIFYDEEVKERGCLTDELLCDEDPKCYSCNDRSNCNNQVPLECHSCTFTSAEPDCLEDPNQVCTTITGCVTLIDDNSIVRDCVQNQPKCRDGSCEVRMTNDQDVCADTSGGETSWKVCASNENKCWRYQQDGVLRLGCSEDMEAICDGNDEHCRACDSILCNEEEIAECSCTECEDQSTKLCDDPTDKCYTGVKDDMVIKGCLKDLESEDGVLTCEGVLCNAAWSCYSCSTSDSDDCLHDTGSSCETVSGCVTLIDGTNVIRGCAENLCGETCENVCNTEFCNDQQVCYACEDCASVNGQKLEMCGVETSTQHKCYSMQDLNDRTISRGCVDEASNEECQPGINCIVCDGTKCNADEPLGVPLLCSRCDLGSCGEYAPAEVCDSVGLLIDRCVVYAPLGVTIYKGCLSSIDDAVRDICLVQSEFCRYCDENYCNTDQLSCHRCSTKEDSFDCLLNPAGSFECNPGDSCTTCSDTDGHLHRGCTSDLVETCAREPAQNIQCQSPNCNKDILPADRHECYQCQNCLQPEQSDYTPCLLYKDNESCYVQAVDEVTVNRGCTSEAPEPCENCLVCSDESGCNTMGPLQKNELSCVTCSSNADCEGRAFGSRCEKDVLIGRTDACYTHFVAKFVIQKGCLSDLDDSNPFYDDCLKNNGNCITCTTSDCNKGKAWCYNCNSADDSDCSDTAYLSSYRMDCEAECVTKLDDEGFTVRGCIEDFEDFDLDSCKASERCEVCAEKNCNTATLPANGFLSCYQCEGSDSPCLEATMPAMMKACPRHVSDDQCYTIAENATWIKRGCLSDLKQSCIEPCLVCTGNGCNREPVLQQNSLVCVNCEGATCKGEKEGRQCTEKVLLGRRDSCYEYDDGETVRKGCLSELKNGEDSVVKESCESDNDEENCRLCDYNNCNGEHNYCVSCNSDEHPECAGRISSVPEALLEDCDESKCVSKFKGSNTITKGCASASEPCQKNDPNCRECEGSFCNNIPFPVDRILCHQCTGCNNPTPEAAICSRYDPEESCYTRLIGDTIQRGCLSETSQLECDEQCFTCTSSGCNNEPSRYDSELSCVHCQGGNQCMGATLQQSKRCGGSIALGATDKCYTLRNNAEVLERGCLANQENTCEELSSCVEETCACDNCNLVDKKKEYTCNKCEGKDCGQAMSGLEQACTGAACVSYVSRDGLVSRGCLQDYETLCSIYGNRHSLCFGDHCNGEVYPVGRMTCYQCEDCTSTDTEQSSICQRYVEHDGCYTLTDGTNVKRGCLSDLPLLECSGSNCESCSDPDCNRNDITTPTDEPAPGTTPKEDTTTLNPTTSTETPFRSCIICSETTSNQRCAWGFKPSAATACPAFIEAKFDCFSCRKDSLVVRGCAADLEENSCDEETIDECNGTGCNGVSFLRQQCAFCTRDCDGSRASFTVQFCPGNVEYENRGCYLFRNARRVVTERGCFAELSEEQRADCLRSGDACVRCTGDVCNGGATKKAFWVGIVAALALALARA